MKLMDAKQMNKPIYLVRYFEEMPDTIFVALHDPQTNSHFLRVMTANQDIDCPDPHGAEITDIFFMTMGTQRIVFTASKDMKLRAYSFNPDMTLQKQAENPT
jgi:hypothetical protein